MTLCIRLGTYVSTGASCTVYCTVMCRANNRCSIYRGGLSVACDYMNMPILSHDPLVSRRRRHLGWHPPVSNLKTNLVNRYVSPLTTFGFASHAQTIHKARENTRAATVHRHKSQLTIRARVFALHLQHESRSTSKHTDEASGRTERMRADRGAHGRAMEGRLLHALSIQQSHLGVARLAGMGHVSRRHASRITLCRSRRAQWTHMTRQAQARAPAARLPREHGGARASIGARRSAPIGALRSGRRLPVGAVAAQ